MTYLLFSKKSSKKHRFSNDFREDKSWFILSNSLNIRCEIGRQSLICEKKQKKKHQSTLYWICISNSTTFFCLSCSILMMFFLKMNRNTAKNYIGTVVNNNSTKWSTIEPVLPNISDIKLPATTHCCKIFK